jgi:hypothetical protein
MLKIAFGVCWAVNAVARENHLEKSRPDVAAIHPLILRGRGSKPNAWLGCLSADALWRRVSSKLRQARSTGGHAERTSGRAFDFESWN